MSAVLLSAVPTLFTGEGALDLDANRELYRHQSAFADGLLVAGTTGEFPALDDTERLSLFELALAELGPARIIGHVGAADTRHARRLAGDAAALGLTRIAAITPYYLMPTQNELASYYLGIRESVSDLEFYAYIFPERAGFTVEPDQFAQIANAAGLAGAKLSGSAAAGLADYAAASPALRFFSGDDSHPAQAVRAGAAGLISGRASAYPEVYAALVAAINAADTAAAERHQRDLDEIVALGASIGRIKHALRLRGIGSGAGRMAVGPPSPEAADAIAAIVAGLPAPPVPRPRPAGTEALPQHDRPVPSP